MGNRKKLAKFLLAALPSSKSSMHISGTIVYSPEVALFSAEFFKGRDHV
jgi:hypothetical protein